jgi:hypothetical protein
MEKGTAKFTIITVFGVLLLGAMLGSLLGELIKMGIPDGVVKEVFLRSIDIMIGPGVVDLTLKFNLIGILGMTVAYYVLRFWR